MPLQHVQGLLNEQKKHSRQEDSLTKSYLTFVKAESDGTSVELPLGPFSS